MDYGLNETQQEIVKLTRQIAEREIDPAAREQEQEHRFPQHLEDAPLLGEFRAKQRRLKPVAQVFVPRHIDNREERPRVQRTFCGEEDRITDVQGFLYLLQEFRRH